MRADIAAAAKLPLQRVVIDELVTLSVATRRSRPPAGAGAPPMAEEPRRREGATPEPRLGASQTSSPRCRRNRPVARAPSRATRWRRCWRGAARCTLSRTWSRRARKRLKVSAHSVTQLQGIQKSRSAGPDHPSHGARAAAKIAAWRVNASPRRRGIPTQSCGARARRRGGALGPWLATRRFAARRRGDERRLTRCRLWAARLTRWQNPACAVAACGFGHGQ